MSTLSDDDLDDLSYMEYFALGIREKAADIARASGDHALIWDMERAYGLAGDIIHLVKGRLDGAYRNPEESPRPDVRPSQGDGVRIGP